MTAGARWATGSGEASGATGVATRALLAFLGEIRDRPLYAGVAEHNHASIRVLEKCGFRVSDEDVGPSDRAVPAFLLLKLTE